MLYIIIHTYYTFIKTMYIIFYRWLKGFSKDIFEQTWLLLYGMTLEPSLCKTDTLLAFFQIPTISHMALSLLNFKKKTPRGWYCFISILRYLKNWGSVKLNDMVRHEVILLGSPRYGLTQFEFMDHTFSTMSGKLKSWYFLSSSFACTEVFYLP